MKIIRAQNLLTEYDTHKFNAEASELGMAPGELIDVIETDYGNSLPFVLISRNDYAFEYKQVAGAITLTIYND